MRVTRLEKINLKMAVHARCCQNKDPQRPRIALRQKAVVSVPCCMRVIPDRTHAPHMHSCCTAAQLKFTMFKLSFRSFGLPFTPRDRSMWIIVIPEVVISLIKVNFYCLSNLYSKKDFLSKNIVFFQC